MFDPRVRTDCAAATASSRLAEDDHAGHYRANEAATWRVIEELRRQGVAIDVDPDHVQFTSAPGGRPR